MKKYIFLLFFLLIPVSLAAQFEQKIGIELSAGGFKTFGNRYTEYTGPLQMPNYKVGLYATGGLQFKLGEHLSLAASFGIMATNGWNYKTRDKENYLSWTIEDAFTGKVLEEGEDYLDFRNFNISARLKYYILTDKKWNPYLSAGVTANWTSAWFENNLWAAQFARGLLPPEDTIPYNDYYEGSFGIGINTGFGVEYSLSSRFHFYAESGYYLILINKNKFKDPARAENFNAAVLQFGCRMYFIKSKEL